MKILITILLILVCSGCASIEYAEPWHKDVAKIADKPYVLGVYDCLHKAREFKALYSGVIINVKLKNGKYHAFNLYKGWLIDCTAGKTYQTGNFEESVWLNYGGKIVDYDYQ